MISKNCLQKILRCIEISNAFIGKEPNVFVSFSTSTSSFTMGVYLKGIQNQNDVDFSCLVFLDHDDAEKMIDNCIKYLQNLIVIEQNKKDIEESKKNYELLRGAQSAYMLK